MKRTLSQREEQVLKLLLAEYNQSEIAFQLNLSMSRINDIKRIIMEKWEIDSKNLMGLLLEGIRRGYVEVDRDNFESSDCNYVYEYKKREATGVAPQVVPALTLVFNCGAISYLVFSS
jgi:hypothetical protein